MPRLPSDPHRTGARSNGARQEDGSRVQRRIESAVATAAMITRAGFAIFAAASVLTAQQTATKKVRLNNTIAKLEKGEAVTHPKDWMFIDMEHGPYLIDRLQATLDGLDKKRD